MMDKTKLKEILKELNKPKKYEVGYVDAQRIVSDGLSIIGKDASDILGFAKEANETRVRRVKGAQAWFKRMYEDGWRFNGTFEYEGLLYNGFVIMERELPNKRLNELIESLTDEERESLPTSFEIDKGPELPQLKEINPDDLHEETPPTPNSVKMSKKGQEIIKEIEEKGQEAFKKKVLEPKEGFEDEITDFIVDAQEGMKSLEELFFDETGKNAIWRGKETKGFIKWKEDRD